jgi:hypothetical protein
MDTLALCEGCLDARHGWMLNSVDVHTIWNVLRGAGRSLDQTQPFGHTTFTPEKRERGRPTGPWRQLPSLAIFPVRWVTPILLPFP